jgi:SAM-dependent methyltransferase
MTTSRSKWQDHEGRASGAEYAAHFAQLASAGHDVHGEASFCDELLRPGSHVMDAGCGTGRVAIRLDELGHHCVGVDSDEGMLAEASRAAPHVEWLLADLAALTPDIAPLAAGFDLVVAAGNVIPLLAHGTEAHAIAGMAGMLHPGGHLVAGFGLDAAHLPIDWAPVDLAGYDAWCAAAGLALSQRWATWDREPYDGGGYAVSVHCAR